MDKLQACKIMLNLTFILPDITGGVYYACLNLAKLLGKKECSSSFVLTRQLEKPAGSSVADMSGFHSRIYSFSATDNKYHIFKKLAKKVPTNSNVIFLNDWLDHNLVTHRRMQQRIISIVHGDYDYYYNMAAASESRIDQFVCVSAAIADKLSILLPNRKNDIVFIPPTVPDMNVDHEVNNENELRIIFVGRLTPEKGFDLLPIVDHELKNAGISCNWTIIAPHATSDYDEWLNRPEVNYYQHVSNDAMPAVYIKQDVILLPSHAEGFPLSILEAMKCGVVPLATNLNTLSTGVIKHEETGFLFELNDVTAIVRQLKNLSQNRPLLSKMSHNATIHARSAYSEDSFREKWTALLSRKHSGKNLNKPVPFNYDRLDTPWLPNAATRAIRKWKPTEKGK